MKMIWAGMIVLCLSLASIFFLFPPKNNDCTYAVQVFDEKTGKALDSVKITYTYNEKIFTGYSDSEGYYRVKICEMNPYPLVKLTAEKDGLKNYSRYISKNLQRIEEIRLKELPKSEKIDPPPKAITPVIDNRNITINNIDDRDTTHIDDRDTNIIHENYIHHYPPTTSSTQNSSSFQPPYNNAPIANPFSSRDAEVPVNDASTFDDLSSLEIQPANEIHQGDKKETINESYEPPVFSTPYEYKKETQYPIPVAPITYPTRISGYADAAHIGDFNCSASAYRLNGSSKNISVPTPLHNGDVISIISQGCSMTIYLLTDNGKTYQVYVLTYPKNTKYIINLSNEKKDGFLERLMGFVADWVDPIKTMEQEEMRVGKFGGDTNNPPADKLRTEKKAFQRAARKIDRIPKKNALEKINKSNLPASTKAILKAALTKKTTGLSNSNKTSKAVKKALKGQGFAGMLK